MSLQSFADNRGHLVGPVVPNAVVQQRQRPMVDREAREGVPVHQLQAISRQGTPAAQRRADGLREHLTLKGAVSGRQNEADVLELRQRLIDVIAHRGWRCSEARRDESGKCCRIAGSIAELPDVARDRVESMDAARLDVAEDEFAFLFGGRRAARVSGNRRLPRMSIACGSSRRLQS